MSRCGYWSFYMICLTIFVLPAFVTLEFFPSIRPHQFLSSPIYWVFFLVMYWISFAATVRRLHDIDKSGWWILIALIPIVGSIILLVWAVRQGDQGPNRFGADPLAASAVEPV